MGCPSLRGGGCSNLSETTLSTVPAPPPSEQEEGAELGEAEGGAESQHCCQSELGVASDWPPRARPETWL